MCSYRMDHAELGTPHFQASSKVGYPDGWITPAGTFYGCTAAEHDASARFILQTHRAHVKALLNKQSRLDVIGEINLSSPREVLKAAGFALLLNGLSAESNLPQTLTPKQLELLKRNQLITLPGSGRLPSSVYESYRDWLAQKPIVSRIVDGLDYEDRLEMEAFIENPSVAFHLREAGDRELATIFNILSHGNKKEVTLTFPSAQDTIKWRRTILPSGDEVFIQWNRHEHWSDEDHVPDHEDFFLLVKKTDVKNFLFYTQRTSPLIMRRFSLEGNLEILA